MKWLRWIALLFTASLVTFIIGTVVEGLWGSGENGRTNWVDQSFGFLMWLGAALTMIFALSLIAAAVAVGTPRLAHRLLHR